MKNISLVLNAILAIAVAVLYYLHFSQPKQVEVAAAPITEESYDIAYINADSVLKNYDYFKQAQEDLQAKTKDLEAKYERRVRSLQKEMADFQKNVASLTMAQAKTLEESLIKKQQNLRVYQETLTQEALSEEAKVNKELYGKVSDFLAQHGRENNLKLVVKYNQGSDIMYAVDSLDITQKVIEGLNSAYKLELEATQPADSTSN